LREWWLRTWLVLTAPSAVFAALRDDSAESAALRSEPVLLIVILAGVAFVLSTPTATSYSGLLLVIWAFLAGAFFGLVTYWLLGAVLYGAGAALGSQGSYRRARHVLAFASVPIALSLVLSPLKFGLAGGTIGSGSGTGTELFDALWIAACAWAAVLLVIGIRAVHGWTWGRAGLASVAPLGIGVLLALV
jgi:Yip1 domain